MLNTGDERVASKRTLLTTIAYQLDGKRTYALEGSIFIAGAAVQWLRDSLKLIGTASELDALGEQADPPSRSIWSRLCRARRTVLGRHARGAIYRPHAQQRPRRVRARRDEAVGYQTRDLIEAMHADWPSSAKAKPRFVSMAA